MQKGKSVYNLQFNCDPSEINKLIGDFLNANNFSLSNKFGENAYYAYDPSHGHRGFQYSINENTVTIYAFLIGLGKQFFMVDNGNKKNALVDYYNSLLNQLFNAIKNPSNAQFANVGSANGNYQGAADYLAQTAANKFTQAVDENIQDIKHNVEQNIKPITKQDVANSVAEYAVDSVNKYFVYMCEAGFWVSIVGLILSLFGFVFTFAIYVADVVFAILGLKTSKRKLAIATFIITGVSLIIITIKLIMIAMSR